MARLTFGASRLGLLDGAVAVWVAVWIALGIAVGANVARLTDLSHTVTSDGVAIQTVGQSLGVLADVPLVGGRLFSRAAREVQAAGTSAVDSGRSSASAVDALSVLLAVVVALLPAVPVLGFYLPLRLARRREARAIRRTIRAHGSDPAFRAFLARRALETLGYDRLLKVTPAPWVALESAPRAALAAAELRRLGIEPGLLDASTGSNR